MRLTAKKPPRKVLHGGFSYDLSTDYLNICFVETTLPSLKRVTTMVSPWGEASRQPVTS